MRFRPRALWVVLALWVIPSHSYADEVAQLSALMSYFGSTCPSQGTLTQTALAQVQALVLDVQAIQSDPDCQTTAGALGQLQVLNQQIQNLANETTQSQILSNQKQEQELLLQYSASSGDSAMQGIIQSSLQSTEVTLAGLEGTQEAQNNIQAVREGQALSTLVSSAGTFMNQSLANQACLLKHPSVLSGIASLAGNVAAAATTSGVSLGLAAATQILDSMVEYIKNKKLAGEVRRLAQGIAENAYECVLESLSDQWCSAQDALNLIQIESDALAPGAAQPKDSVWQGVELLNRELPILLNWLSEVEVGTQPTNDAAALRQKRAFERDAEVKTDDAYGSGIITENVPAFVAADGNLQSQWNIEKTAIVQFVNELSLEQALANNQWTNPLLDIYGSDFAPYYLLGLTQSQTPLAGSDFCPISTFNPFAPPTTANPCGWPLGIPTFAPNLQQIQINLKAWIAEAQTKVDSELTTVLQSDPLQVVNDALSKDLQGRSVTGVIDTFVHFLQEQGAQARAAHTINVDTIKKLKAIQKSIKTGSSSNDKAAEAVSEIYAEANLSYGTVLFQNRLESAIRLNLNAIVTNGTSMSNDTDILLLTAADVMSELEIYSGTSNLTLAKQDAIRAQRTTSETIGNFASVFGANINEVLKDYASHSDAGTDDLRAQVCLELLAVPEWPKDISQNYCIGMQLPPTFTGGPPSVKITKQLMQADLQSRACAYGRYLRNSQIYQNYSQNH